MSKVRDNAIKALIQNKKRDIGCYAVDKNGELFWFKVNIELLKYSELRPEWRVGVPFCTSYVGSVRSFNGDGWKKSLWNTNGEKINLNKS